jgi:hypothetical protein
VTVVGNNVVVEKAVAGSNVVVDKTGEQGGRGSNNLGNDPILETQLY